MTSVNFPRAGAGLAAAVVFGVLCRLTIAHAETAAVAVEIDQCANGTLSVPVVCTGNAWTSGGVSSSKAYWFEGDSTPFRVLFSGLSVGYSYAYTVEWDTTKGGKHAYDYLTGFNRTESTADPCSGVIGCSPSGSSTFPIPADPSVTGSITQIPGTFVMYGATLVGVSAYSASGTYLSDGSTRITITFSASASNPVLAFSAHIASRADWDPYSTALSIAGSPYRMRQVDLNGTLGTTELTLNSDAVHGPQLAVGVVVDNKNGDSFVPADFMVEVTATDPYPYQFPGAADPGTVVLLAPGDYRVKLATEGYGATYTAGCAGTVDVSDSNSCTITIDTDVIFTDAFDSL